jgi:hypothetical protein
MAHVSVLGIDLAQQMFHVVGMDDMKQLFSDIDPEYTDLCHGFRLLR